MKDKARLVLMCVLAGLLLGSCTMVLGFIIPNRIQVDGAEFDISKFYLLNYGRLVDNQNHYLDLWLVSDGVVIDPTGEGAGTGDVIGLWLISSTPTLGEGTFQFVEDFFGSPGTMYAGRVYAGADYGASSADATYNLSGGTVEVSRPAIGDDYIIEFTGTAEGGIQVSARYRGPLETEYDMDGIMVAPNP